MLGLKRRWFSYQYQLKRSIASLVWERCRNSAPPTPSVLTRRKHRTTGATGLAQISTGSVQWKKAHGLVEITVQLKDRNLTVTAPWAAMAASRRHWFHRGRQWMTRLGCLVLWDSPISLLNAPTQDCTSWSVSSSVKNWLQLCRLGKVSQHVATQLLVKAIFRGLPLNVKTTKPVILENEPLSVGPAAMLFGSNRIGGG